MTSEPLILFDRYDVGCELGKGTYGIVRKAFDTRQKHHVAIKCVCLGEEGIPSTALREISLLRPLNHNNIIRLYDIQVHQSTSELFLFYECMEMDLYEYMKLYRKPLPDDLSKSYLKQMLLGIDYVHSNSMLHRDLKPQNSLCWLFLFVFIQRRNKISSRRKNFWHRCVTFRQDQRSNERIDEIAFFCLFFLQK